MDWQQIGRDAWLDHNDYQVLKADCMEEINSIPGLILPKNFQNLVAREDSYDQYMMSLSRDKAIACNLLGSPPRLTLLKRVTPRWAHSTYGLVPAWLCPEFSEQYVLTRKQKAACRILSALTEIRLVAYTHDKDPDNDVFPTPTTEHVEYWQEAVKALDFYYTSLKEKKISPWFERFNDGLNAAKTLRLLFLEQIVASTPDNPTKKKIPTELKRLRKWAEFIDLPLGRIGDQTLATDFEKKFPPKADWELVEPNRLPGYRRPLYELIGKWKDAGHPPPRPADILKEWRIRKPPEIMEVRDREFLYYSSGNEPVKSCGIKALGQAINSLIKMTSLDE
ncbi:MAG: hypothetical protein CMK32_05250 [Porticoccaceae bacterium]|nr:hypothetical protein [Porticoccaceae bacterium]